MKKQNKKLDKMLNEIFATFKSPLGSYTGTATMGSSQPEQDADDL